MTNEKVTAIMQTYKDLVPSDSWMILKNSAEKADDSKYDNLLIVKTVNPMLVLILSIFLGGLGIDRFVVGDVGLGICKLLFGWITFGIWPLIDIFFCYKKAKQKNLQILLSAL